MGGGAQTEDNASDKIFSKIGQFGRYQLLIVVLASATGFIPAMVSYGYVFYGAMQQA